VETSTNDDLCLAALGHAQHVVELLGRDVDLQDVAVLRRGMEAVGNVDIAIVFIRLVVIAWGIRSLTLVGFLEVVIGKT
jgi:hypothetical protein